MPVRIGRLLSVFSVIRSKDSNSASFRTGRILPSPRFKTWNTCGCFTGFVELRDKMLGAGL